MPDDVPDARSTPATPALGPGDGARPRRRAQLLLVLPFVALLAVPLYAREEPSLLGWPFFYWYQFAWGLITIGLMALVYRLTRSSADDDDAG
jgi:hypothetical protein